MKNRPKALLLGAFLAAASLDFRIRDLGYGGPAIHLLEILTLFAMLWVLADTSVAPRTPGAISGAFWHSNPYLVLYAGWAFLSGLIGMLEAGKSIYIFRNLLPAFFFFACLTFYLKEPTQIRWILLAFLAASIPNLALGLSQYIFETPYPVPLNINSNLKMDLDGSFITKTVSGIFNHPNAFSTFLLPVFITSMGFSFSKGYQGIGTRVFSIAIAGIAATLLHATRAKGAWAWSAIGICILFAPSIILRLKGAWILLLASLIGLILTAVLVSLQLGGAFNTMLTRVYLWNSALHVIEGSNFVAFFGNGQDNVWDVSARLSDLQYNNAHNVFLNQAVYFGIPGAVLYFMAFVRSIQKSQQCLNQACGKNLHHYSRISLAVLISTAGQYFFEPASESTGLALNCFFFMGVAVSAERMSRKR